LFRVRGKLKPFVDIPKVFLAEKTTEVAIHITQRCVNEFQESRSVRILR
jgi:hypothetical protein